MAKVTGSRLSAVYLVSKLEKLHALSCPGALF